MSSEPITEAIAKRPRDQRPRSRKPEFQLEISCGGVVIAGIAFDPIKLNAVLLAIETATGKKFQ